MRRGAITCTLRCVDAVTSSFHHFDRLEVRRHDVHAALTGRLATETGSGGQCVIRQRRLGRVNNSCRLQQCKQRTSSTKVDTPTIACLQTKTILTIQLLPAQQHPVTAISLVTRACALTLLAVLCLSTTMLPNDGTFLFMPELTRGLAFLRNPPDGCNIHTAYSYRKHVHSAQRTSDTYAHKISSRNTSKH